jgi:cytochrome c peroxidase
VKNGGKFRTPTVRNVDLRPSKGFPKTFIHNGVFKSLEEVVSFYNTDDVPEMGGRLLRASFMGFMQESLQFR